MNLLELRELKTYFNTGGKVVRAVDGINLTVERGKTAGLVGEAGCGKTVTALSIMGLVPPPGKTVAGEILLEEENLLGKNAWEMAKIRGRKISIVFQEPLSCLNPVLRVGRQIEEAIRLHQGLGQPEAREKAVSMLDLVGIPSPRVRARDYAHQLSGGMRQRVMIAMALSCHPSLLIADEPTTALDVTIQAQILELLQGLTQELETALLLITHDFGIVAKLCDRISVMYAGKIVESAPARSIFKHPRHPYTRGLLNAIPRIDRDVHRLESISGVIPNPADLPAGCIFHPRCPEHEVICHREYPAVVQVGTEHWVSCWKHAPGGVF